MHGPFAPLDPLVATLQRSPMPAVLFIEGDDEWIVAEAARRLAIAFRETWVEGEVNEYEAHGNGVQEACADASTIALFATNRLVSLDATELFRGKRLTAEELDALLDDAKDASGSNDARILDRLAVKAAALVRASGTTLPGAGASAEEQRDAAKKVCNRVKRGERADELAGLLARIQEDDDEDASAAGRLLDFIQRAKPGDNVLLVRALHPDPEHDLTKALKRGHVATFRCDEEPARRRRLADIGLERCIERGVVAETDVFDVLTDRGRLSARPFLNELDRLLAGAQGGRVTGEAAVRLVADERKEYGSDFVEAVGKREFPRALALLERLMAADDFSAFRPWGNDAKGGKGGGAPGEGGKKGPKGDAAFFPLLGLLGGELRRMLALKAALVEIQPDAAKVPAPPHIRRVDYRSFQGSLLLQLRSPAPGRAGLRTDGHPFILHRSYLASFDWSLRELIDALSALAGVDAAVKSGEGSGPDLLESWLLSRIRPAAIESRRRTVQSA